MPIRTDEGPGSGAREQSAREQRVARINVPLLPDPWAFWEAWMSFAMWPWLIVAGQHSSEREETAAAANDVRTLPEPERRHDNVIYLKFR